MQFRKLTELDESFDSLYERILIPNFSMTELLPKSAFNMYVTSDNMSIIVAEEGDETLGVIVYSKMPKAQLIFTHYLYAEKDTMFIQLVTVAMLDELCSTCLMCKAELTGNYGFNTTGIKWLQPKLAYYKRERECELLVYGANSVSKKCIKKFLTDYFTKIAFVPKPENDSTYFTNMSYLRNYPEVIKCSKG